jgi:hypothetical protein
MVTNRERSERIQEKSGRRLQQPPSTFLKRETRSKLQTAQRGAILGGESARNRARISILAVDA